MNSRIVCQALESIKSAFGTGTSGILDKSAERVIPPAIEAADYTYKRYKREPKRHHDWGYEIHGSEPLRFKPSMILEGSHVDVYCKIFWKGGSSIPWRQEVKVRVWSDDEHVNFRPLLDSENVKEELKMRPVSDRRRVISRIHFDRANLTKEDSKHYHPEFHLQVGGVPNDNELCWHPKRFNLPRIPIPPMELFLTCQLVAINFFPEEYDKIKDEPHWRGSLYKIQRFMLQDYHEKCARDIRKKRSLLDALRA